MPIWWRGTRPSFLKKAGFQLDGVIRRSYKVDDRWVDAVHMTMLDDEWPAAKALREAAGPSGTQAERGSESSAEEMSGG